MHRPELTSIRAPRVVAARRLTKRAFRAGERRFLAEGPQAIREALSAPGVLLELFATADALDRHAGLVETAERAHVPVHQVSGQVLESLAATVSPQGLVGVCRLVDVPLATLASAEMRLVAVLAHVRDPGNAGTVVRAADAAGADGVVLTDASVDLYNGKAVRASAGSLFHLPVVAGVRAADAADTLRAAGLRVLAADGNADRDLDDLADAGELASPTAWVFGNEAWGLPPEVLALADDTVRIPLHGRAESLNLATAAAVCLYASARAQRRAPQGGRERAAGPEPAGR